MEKRLYECVKITDLKDMLNKTKVLYGNNIAYKIKLGENKYITYTHKEIREMIDALRNEFNKYGAKE